MSYEGYTQYLCKNGHTWIMDCLEEDSTICEGSDDCDAPVVWWNMVDQTNGCEPAEGDITRMPDHTKLDDCICGSIELERLEEKRCDKCNHVLEQRFKVPKKGGHTGEPGDNTNG